MKRRRTEVEAISVYTDDDGIEDGILVKLEHKGKAFGRWINIATSNLIGKGYEQEDGSLNIPNVIDLVRQGEYLIRQANKESGDASEFDWFYAGSIELPSGEKEKVFIAENGTSAEKGQRRRYTIMLPEDY